MRAAGRRKHLNGDRTQAGEWPSARADSSSVVVHLFAKLRRRSAGIAAREELELAVNAQGLRGHSAVRVEFGAAATPRQPHQWNLHDSRVESLPALMSRGRTTCYEDLMMTMRAGWSLGRPRSHAGDQN